MKKTTHKIKKKTTIKVRFKIVNTNHLVIKATLNGVAGRFIVDTGASNTCIGAHSIAHFNLNVEQSQTIAAGAFSTGVTTQLAKNNTLKINKWTHQTDLVVFDLTHINEVLKSCKVKAVDGILGADILIAGNAIIDYSNRYLSF